MVLEDQEASAEAAGDSETEAETPAAEAAMGEAHQSEEESAATGKNEEEKLEGDEGAGQQGEAQVDGAVGANGARKAKAWAVTIKNLDKVKHGRGLGGGGCEKQIGVACIVSRGGLPNRYMSLVRFLLLLHSSIHAPAYVLRVSLPAGAYPGDRKICKRVISERFDEWSYLPPSPTATTSCLFCLSEIITPAAPRPYRLLPCAAL